MANCTRPADRSHSMPVRRICTSWCRPRRRPSLREPAARRCASWPCKTSGRSSAPSRVCEPDCSLRRELRRYPVQRPHREARPTRCRSRATSSAAAGFAPSIRSNKRRAREWPQRAKRERSRDLQRVSKDSRCDAPSADFSQLAPLVMNGAGAAGVPEGDEGTCISPPPPPTRCRVPTPLGRDLLIVGNAKAILASDFVRPARSPGSKPTDALLVEAAAQVRAYFARRLRLFDLPLALDGTPFQIAVWRAVGTLSLRRVRLVRRRCARDRSSPRPSRRR